MAGGRGADTRLECFKEALSHKASRQTKNSHARSSHTVFPILGLSGAWDTEVLFLEGDLQALEVASSLSVTGTGVTGHTQQDEQAYEICPCC